MVRLPGGEWTSSPPGTAELSPIRAGAQGITMLTARAVGLSPLAVLAGAGVLFGVWIALDAVQPTRPAADRPGRAVPDERPASSFPPPEVVLGVVRTGMPQPLVEGHLRKFAELDGVALTESSVSPFRKQYRLHLVRPIPHLMSSGHINSFRPGRHVLAVAYDPNLPHHPLIQADLAPE
jgi:hypothetical protein